jgi:hypothetical protein
MIDRCSCDEDSFAIATRAMIANSSKARIGVLI